MLRHLPLVASLPLAVLAGCSCNQDYSFPKGNDLDEVSPPESFGSWLSMDAAPDDKRVAMAYYDRTIGAVGFAVGVPDGDQINWVHERVDGYPGSDGLDRGNFGHYNSLKVAPDGTVWVAYKDVGNGGLYVAHRLGPQNWETALVDAGAGMGNWASLDIDASGNPVIAHHDDRGSNLRVCRVGSEASWTCEVAWTGQDAVTPNDTGVPVITPARVGEYAKLMIAGGVEHIAFYDGAQGSLDLLEGTAGNYAHTVVDDGGDVGQWPSMILDDNDDLLIAYHDVGDQDLMLSSRVDGQWSKEVIDDGEYVGADSELFYEGDELAVLYFDGFNNDMKVAKKTGGNWTIAKLAGDGEALGFHNEVVQVAGQTWTASFNYTTEALYTRALTVANN